MRRASVERILYASGSGVYGDLGETEADEDWGPLVPISTYGASKLAGEALISAYSFMFGLSGRVFRFGNVVGPWQTHGVGLDFVRALLDGPDAHFASSGDGTQSKSYVHVDDVIGAMLLAHRAGTEPYDVYNVATGDYITVAEIADLAAECVGLDPAERAVRVHGRRAGLEGRRPGRAALDRAHPRARLGADAHLARGAARVDDGARRGRPRRPAVSRARAVFFDRDGTLIAAPVVDGRPRLDPQRGGARARGGRRGSLRSAARGRLSRSSS